MLRRFKRGTELDFTVWKEREVVNFVELFITADDCPRNAEIKTSLAPESLKPTQRKPEDTPMQLDPSRLPYAKKERGGRGGAGVQLSSWNRGGRHEHHSKANK